LDGGRGAIEVRIGSDRTVYTLSSLGLGVAMPGDNFGKTVEMVDLGGDYCADFVVGAPGVAGTGVVYVLRGSPEGIKSAYAVRLPDARRGDEFGYSLSGGYLQGPIVVAGAPGRDLGAAANAGVIGWFRPSATGPGPVAVTSQATAGVAGSPETGDQFAEVLGPTFNELDTAVRLLVGAPHEDVGPAVDAGIVEQVTLIPNGRGPSSKIYRQQKGGLIGVPESGDRFGSAIAVNDDIDSNTLAIGVPGEDVGRTRNAGAVDLFTDEWGFPDDIDYRPRRAVTQRSPGIPGSVEAGDTFGASLQATSYCEADEDGSGSASADFAIGAPGEDLGDVLDAGTVTLYDTGLLGDGRPVTACLSHLIRQDGLAAGHAEPRDGLGADLGYRLGNELLIAAPGEDVGAVVDAGLIDVVDLGRLERRPAEQFSGGPRAHLHYANLH
jgi:hypothetical protein